jgi:two-component system response regulator HydG
MRKFRILIVCPEPEGLALLTSMLKSLGHLIEEAATDRIAVRLMERDPINLVLASVDPADSDALELLAYVRRKHSGIPVILMFPRVHPERAKEALRLGAMAVLKYPVPAAELRATVLQALEHCESRPVEPPSPAAVSPAGAGHSTRQMIAAQAVPQSLAIGAPEFNGGPISPAIMNLLPGGAFATVLPLGPLSPAAPARTPSPDRAEALAREVDFLSVDPCMRQIVELAGTLAPTLSSVLILGEPGTGKSHLAQLLHHGGGQGDRPLVTFDGAGFVEPGQAGEDSRPISQAAATALAEWSTRISQARGGTLHVEEVGALLPEVQLQLLRELQIHDIESSSGHARPYGRPSVRFVLSSSENLPSLVEQGKFRPELYHRISTVCLMIPPLRLRGADIEILAEHFRDGFSQEFRKSIVGFGRDALDALQRHDWPGNVRELKGVVQRAVALCPGPRITSTQLSPILNPHRPSRGGSASAPRPHLPMGIRPLKEALEEPEKKIIIQALQAFNWNRQETARVLDINRTTLYKKMKKYGLLVDEPMWAN